MPSIHDRGGWPDAGPIDHQEHHLADWELRTDALMRVLSASSKGLIRVDELRRAIESLDPDRYENCLYYERWAQALEALVLQKELLDRDDIEARVAELAQSWR